MEWVIAWGPQIALIGAIIVAIGAWATTQQQNRQQAKHQRQIGDLQETLAQKSEESAAKSDQLAAKSDEIARLTRQGLATITGGDSFCTLHVTDIEERGVGTLRLRHHGAFPLYDVLMSITATKDALDAGRGMGFRVGTMAPDTVRILRHGHALPTGDSESKEMYVRFSSRNGVWTQKITFRRVGDTWKTATKAHRRVGSSLREIFAETDEGFRK